MKKNFLLITGGTGGHVIPALNFANYLISKNINCTLIVDKRGYRYISNFSGKIHIINSSNLNGNFLKKIFGLFNLIHGFIKSFLLILYLKPTKVISFGSYASFFPMISCLLIKFFYKIEIFIHEQNSVVGRTNKFFLYFSNKIFLNFNIEENIEKKFKHKSYVVGTPENNSKNLIINKDKYLEKNFTILIYGGSQGSKFISKFAVNLIKIIKAEKIIKPKYIIQCPKEMIEYIKNELQMIETNTVVKDFFFNIDEILQNTSIAISRAGAGSINDLIKYNISSILIPLPTSKDNHQFHNASIISKYNLGIIIDQNQEELNKAKKYIYDVYKKSNNIESINEKFNKIKVKNSNSLIYNLIINGK